MALTPRLEIKQGQALVMTPQLQQAIKLLQLSNIEINGFVAEQLEKNPLLEVEERSNISEQRRDGDTASDSDKSNAADKPMTETVEAISTDAPSTDAEAALDTDHDNIYTDEATADVQNNAAAEEPQSMAMDWSPAAGGGGSTSFSDDLPGLEATLSSDITLRDHLLEQLSMSNANPLERVIGADLIENVDEAGYLSCDLCEVAMRLGADAALVESTLGILQTFEPAGICARNLAECLTLQLQEKNRFDPAMQALLENLDLLAKRKSEALKKLCGVDDEDLNEMINEIRDLDPKPGLRFTHDIVQTVVPDVFVRPNTDGGWKIELNSDTLPRVLINQNYFAEVSKSAQSKDDKNYLTECFNNANWLIKSLDQRAKTILKVATELVKQQDGFLVQGIQFLRPLNLKVIADAISMHESTVSRVTANKYIATPRGVFEMKYFFTSAIASSSGGEAHSAEAVRHRIKDLIDNEPPNKILSDDRIVEILKSSGIDIARRTVAKYREAMKIPSSVQRRRLKREPA